VQERQQAARNQRDREAADPRAEQVRPV